MTHGSPCIRLAASKPKGRVARRLIGMGLTVESVDEDEGNVDRYVLSKRVVVERRTGSSFLLGIMDKTLFTSAIYLREHFHVPVLIVEGRVDYERRGFHPQAVRGALSSMMLVYGLSVLSASDEEETAELLAMMARHEQVGVPEISLIPKRKAADLPDLQRRVIEMLPGAGMVLARELLQHFGSIRRIVNTDADELLAVPGLGKKKAAHIRQVFDAEYEAVDTERQLEDAVQADHSLLFDRPVQLLARQLLIYTAQKDRHVVDMVFLDSAADELILVELKRGPIGPDHVKQIRRYLDNAHKSKLLAPFLAAGSKIRGVLASVEPSRLEPDADDITAIEADKRRVLAVLKRLRAERLGEDVSAR